MADKNSVSQTLQRPPSTDAPQYGRVHMEQRPIDTPSQMKQFMTSSSLCWLDSDTPGEQVSQNGLPCWEQEGWVQSGHWVVSALPQTKQLLALPHTQ
jgi:hypothetical protein